MVSDATLQLLLLVDKNDRFLGKYALKDKCHTGRGLHHRAFTILIYNKKGEILLQKRKHVLWDGFWDLTNSHPLHLKNGDDESYLRAARRCLKREWGIKTPVVKLFGFNYFAKFANFCENEYCAFLVGEYSGKVFPNPEVAYGYRWSPFKKLLREIKNSPGKYTPWALIALSKFSSRAKDICFPCD